MMDKHLVLWLLFAFMLATGLYGQDDSTLPKTTPYIPILVGKSNTLYNATTTFNLGLELRASRKVTVDFPINYNPWTFSDNKKLKHWLIQPEVRYWLCEAFSGHFLGIHAHAAQFNVGGINFPVGNPSMFKDYRYEGYLYGAGVSYGYQWILHPRWNLELSVGAGYARIHYNKFPCRNCGTKMQESNYNYLGVTKTSLSLIYVIK
jgi:hypothetical protein